MPDLGAGSDEAAVRLAVEDQPAADTGPEGEHDHVVSPSRADLPLGDRGRVAVVVEGDRDARTARSVIAKVEVGERNVDRVDDAAVRWSIVDGSPKPIAATASPRNSSTISSSTSRNSSRDSVGVGRSTR